MSAGSTATCPICAEDYSIGSPGKVLQCCSSILCQNCLYSHITSILEEGITGEGRKQLTCPFGCKDGTCRSGTIDSNMISDKTVRETFRAKHQHPSSLPRYIIGRFLYTLFSMMGRLHPTSMRICQDKITLFWRFSQSLGERKDLELYAKWNLSVGLSHKIDNDDSGENKNQNSNNHKTGAKSNIYHGSATHVYVHVMQCPRADCECLWLVHKPYREKKLAHERQYNAHKHQKRHDQAPKSYTMSSLMLNCSSMFYKPIAPEKEEAMMNKYGYTTAHWMNPIDIDVFQLTLTGKGQSRSRTHGRHNDRLRLLSTSINAPRDQHHDGRMVVCPACDHEFCGLCARPWSALSNSSGVRVCHTGKLCSLYSKRASDDDGFLDAADAGDARLCPGCSMRTNRTDGCNHMTCVCGYHWCYICECRFDSRHYRCKDGDCIGGGSNGGSNNCIIS